MAPNAKARETFVALRHAIARIEDRLAERLESTDDVCLTRRHGRIAARCELLVTGVERFDMALGGGLPGAGLTEIHAACVKDAAAAAGFTLALARSLIERTALPFLWIGMAGSFREAGYPYPPGLHFLYGVEPSRFVVAQAEKLVEALWIAEQAVAVDGFCAILLETRGPSTRLDLTATRRLHRRALDAGRPLFLIRQAVSTEPTAAAFRLILRSAPAGLRHVLDKPLPRSIGPPAFLVEISKNRTAPPAQFILEWNPHARAFEERGTQDFVPVVSTSQHRTPVAAAVGARVAFSSQPASTPAGDKPSGEQHPAHRRAG